MNVEEHLLTCFGEECAELVKEASKALRFGLEDRNVLNPTGPTNRERLVDELNDLAAVAQLLVQEGIIPLRWADYDKQEAKKQKVRKFMEYARKVGALKD